MSRTPKFSPKQCEDLAKWYETTRTVRAKAKELHCSVPALYDAIARGQGRLTSATRHKLSEAELEALVNEVSRETTHSESFEDVA